jgi:DEAD/DEAH box helicase domain-containing protein
MTEMLRVFGDTLETHDYSVIESVDLPSRPERLEPIPDEYRSGSVNRWLGQSFPGGLWSHQADALRRIAANANVVIATGTASGKTLVFQSAALHLLDHSPDAAVLVFYPLKALVADQLVSWRRVLASAGYSEDTVASLHGDVRPDERDKLMRTARVIVATPDVTHAWLMSNLAKPQHKRFFGRLRLVVIDEAHVFDSVFGSNFAYLFRRIIVAARLANRRDEAMPLRVVAASATISNPAEHLLALTGLEFEVVDEKCDGSPRHDRRILHLATSVGTEASLAAGLQRDLLSGSDVGSFITFVDSRQGAERLALSTDVDDSVRPYRSGYENTDRSAIEERLRDGSLRGVVSTSALELGIDIPHFSVGLNIGVPASRKSFRQRLGRVGRKKPGAFAIIAEPYALRRFGTTLAEYYANSVEPSYLYLQNRFIQFAHARCLADELEMLGVVGKKALPGFVSWPGGFKGVFDFSYVGGAAARPREFDNIHRVGGDAPHYNYPLRNVAEEGFIVATGGGASGPQRRVGSLTLQQAIREAFPGAIYLHLAAGWKVHEWRSTAFERAIRVSTTPSRAFPKPLLRTFVNISIERDAVVEGRYRKSETGFLAECQLQITERVEGFVDRGERKLYRDLQATDPCMRSKTRDFRTTGVVLRIGEPWFTKKGVKEKVAEALRELLLREYSISPSDVDSAATNISLLRGNQKEATVDAIVLYDSTHGSLRLSEPAYTRLDELLKRLKSAVESTPDEADLLPSDIVASLCNWADRLDKASGDDIAEVLDRSGDVGRDGWLQVYARGSQVAKRDIQGVLTDIEIIEPEIADLEGAPTLCYRYRVAAGGRAFTRADAIEAVGDGWHFEYWNPRTDKYLDAIDDLIVDEREHRISLTDSVSEAET